MASVEACVTERLAEITEKRYQTFIPLLTTLRERNPFADRQKMMKKLEEKFVAVIGPKGEADKAPSKGAPKKSDTDSADAGRVKIQDSIRFPDPKENHQNLKETLEKHLASTGGKVVTRFPPEPNGYLHLGHAKAMSLDFGYAKKTGGICYMRFDDTNPEAESQEYIDSILDSVKWMGHSWVKITHASDYFEELYNLAVELVRRGKAFVCHQTSEQVAESREKREPSPWRDRPIEESLKLFADMRDGKFKEGEATLRMKMDIRSPNPCMWDLVAYRIKYHPHPHAGDKWCIYPSYDFTHCLNDSLENITHSLCTLEFGPRRESYNWLIDSLDMYRPVVWEYGRLSLTHTVLSKRKLIKIVKDGIVRGWDDPRMPTIVGVRRRGFTPEAINTFCEKIGVTRSDSVVIDYGVLEECVRDHLNDIAIRAMAVLEPLKVTIANWDKGVYSVERPNIPEKDKGTNKVPISGVIYIEKSDFKEVDVKDYFGLALKTANGQPKWVRLKYAFPICVTDVKRNDQGEIVELIAEYDKDGSVKKPIGGLHWVAQPEAGKEPLKIECRLYKSLFKSANPGELENWLGDIDPDSLQVVHAFADPSVLSLAAGDKLQFERVGYFCVDPDTKDGNVVVNRTVTLKESKFKPK
jgi:glutaminyl-tRNA synthetase